MKNKIIEMLKMQEKLDKYHMEYKGRTEPLTIEEVSIALFDELGEVNHEMKGDWCYWKKSQKPVDKEKVKEELADVLHFALSLHILFNGFEFDIENLQLTKRWFTIDKWSEVLRSIAVVDESVLYDCIVLCEKLGFTFDEMYEAYIEKDKENYERMKTGY